MIFLKNILLFFIFKLVFGKLLFKILKKKLKFLSFNSKFVLFKITSLIPRFFIENKLKNSEKELKSLFAFRDELKKDLGQISDGVENANEAAKSQLECPICLEMMKPPTKIWMCPQTHLVCDACREGMVNNVCPTCRSGKITGRAFLAENISRALFGK